MSFILSQLAHVKIVASSTPRFGIILAEMSDSYSGCLHPSQYAKILVIRLDQIRLDFSCLGYTQFSKQRRRQFLFVQKRYARAASYFIIVRLPFFLNNFCHRSCRSLCSNEIGKNQECKPDNWLLFL